MLRIPKAFAEPRNELIREDSKRDRLLWLRRAVLLGDRVEPLSEKTASLVTLPTRICQRNDRQPAKAHLPLLASTSIQEEPSAGAARVDRQIQSPSIRVPSSLLDGRDRSGTQLVHRTSHVSDKPPAFTPAKRVDCSARLRTPATRFTVRCSGATYDFWTSADRYGQGAGGERGIRTLDTVARIHAFQACAFNHSATSPRPRHAAGPRAGRMPCATRRVGAERCSTAKRRGRAREVVAPARDNRGHPEEGGRSSRATICATICSSRSAEFEPSLARLRGEIDRCTAADFARRDRGGPRRGARRWFWRRSDRSAKRR
jgi:hypothetical protein